MSRPDHGDGDLLVAPTSQDQAHDLLEQDAVDGAESPAGLAATVLARLAANGSW